MMKISDILFNFIPLCPRRKFAQLKYTPTTVYSDFSKNSIVIGIRM